MVAVVAAAASSVELAVELEVEAMGALLEVVVGVWAV